MARKAFVVNEAMRENVRHLAGLGIRQDHIAKIIGCAPKTLRKRFRDDLDRGVAVAIATIANNLFAAAKSGNVPAQIFYLKTQGHWRESPAPRDPAPHTDVQSNSSAVVILPNNDRDPELTRFLQEAQEKYFAGKKRPPSSQITT
jgi:hypothetical protein